jgi:hypothetical protein
MGGNMKPVVIEMLKKGVPLIPVTVQDQNTFVRLMDMEQPVDLKNPDLVDGWTNFFRSDDWCSTAYFYLDKPVNQLPLLANTDVRTTRLEK